MYGTLSFSDTLRENPLYSNEEYFWYLVHVISWNWKTSKKTDKLTYVWAICSKIFANKSDLKE